MEPLERLEPLEHLERVKSIEEFLNAQCKFALRRELYYETHGQGEPLVLIPSTGFSAEAWKPSQLPLAESTNLILHDPRGCGRSVAAQQVYSINQMANDVVALLDHLKIPSAHLCGHSMGGRIASWSWRSTSPDG